MLKIRLQRVGRKNDPAFRVVVVDSKQGVKSKNTIEQVGFYNPKSKEKSLDAERITHWIAQGAQASDTMHNMLIREGIIKGEMRNPLPKKTPIVKEAPEEPVAKPEAVAPVVSTEAETETIEPMPTEEAPVESPTEDAPVEQGPPKEDPVEEEAEEESAPEEIEKEA